MFKFAVVIATVAVSMSLAGSIPNGQDLNTASTHHMVAHKTHRPEKIVFVSEVSHESDSFIGNMLNSKLLGLLEAISIPKKIAGSVINFLTGQLKSIGVKKILKTALLGALATGLGAVAAAALAGLASLVSVVCAVFPYLKMFFGGKGHHDHDHHQYDSHIDAVSDFAYGAFNKYDEHYNA